MLTHPFSGSRYDFCHVLMIGQKKFVNNVERELHPDVVVYINPNINHDTTMWNLNP